MAQLKLHWFKHPPAHFTRGAVTIGNFDGVHRGHQSLIATVVRQARACNGPAVAVTFDPPPIALLNPAVLRPPLTTIETRVELLHAAGADHVVVLETDPGLLAISPEAFFEDVLCGLFEARAVVEGYNFHFGRNRAGNTATLRTMCETKGMQFEEMPALHDTVGVISSSRVRNAILGGDVRGAAELLARNYSLAGIVEVGQKRGRTIGFPTANLGAVGTEIPKEGVYAVRVHIGDRLERGAMNIGPNPTFGEDAKKLEVHVLDFSGDLYGQNIDIEFVQRLRNTRAFPGIPDLMEQLQRDVEQTRAVLG